MNEPTLSVVGVTFEGRDAVLRRIWHEQGMDVQARLRRDPGNKYDANAVAVDVLEVDSAWVQVGFLPRIVAKALAPYLSEHGSLRLGAELRGGRDVIGIGVNANDIAAAYNLDPERVALWERVGREQAMSNRPTGPRRD